MPMWAEEPPRTRKVSLFWSYPNEDMKYWLNLTNIVLQTLFTLVLFVVALITAYAAST